MVNTGQQNTLAKIKNTIKRLEIIRDNPKITPNLQLKAQMYSESLTKNPGNINNTPKSRNDYITNAKQILNLFNKNIKKEEFNQVRNYKGYKINPQTLLENAKAKASLTQTTPIKPSIYTPNIKKQQQVTSYTPPPKTRFKL